MQDGALRIETIDAPARLHAIAPAWRDLAANAEEPNIFYEPMALLPALALPAAEGMTCLAAWMPCGERLAGLLPVKRWKRKNPLLPEAIETWEYPLRESADPLVRSGCEHAFWKALLPHLDRAPGGFTALRLSKLHADSATVTALHEVTRSLGRPLYVTRRYERAALFGGVSPQAYLARLSPKVAREQKRRSKRLAELGAVTFDRLDGEADFNAWLDEFLRLEQSGWKGKAGVAAAADPKLAAMLRAMLAEALAEGRLDMRRMRVGERTISMLIHIVTGRSAVSLKIAYDEDYARFSPGVMLQLEYLDDGLRLERVDSSARAGHPMFDRIWIDRLPIVSLMVPFNRPAARAACAAEQAVRSLAAAVKRRRAR